MDSELSYETPQDDVRLVIANSKFSFNLYMHQATGNDGNIFISPISISVSLAMAYLGARGNTLTEMKKCLYFDELTESQFHQVFCELMEALKVSDHSYTLHMANCLFGERSYTFLDEFLQLCKAYYKSELAPVGFIENTAAAAAQINQWVSENTNQKIPSIISANDIDELTRLVLVNAIYFKGDWQKKFKDQNTEDADFLTDTKEKVKVSLMHVNKSKFRYGSNPNINCQALELPYVNNALSMFILLPDNTVSSLKDLEAKLTHEHFTNIEKMFWMSEREVNVWLPRFKLDEKLDVKKILSVMGIEDLFNRNASDLSGIDGTRDLYVSKVLHRAFIEVNEEGSEAAAATAVVMMTRCAPMLKEAFDFKADHPFLFLIRHNRTKSILFLGRLMKPQL